MLAREPLHVMFAPEEGFTSDLAVSSAGAAAVVTKNPVGAGWAYVVSSISWSYSSAPTGGRVTIVDSGGDTLDDFDITAAGPGERVYEWPIQGVPGNGMTITLAGGGGSIVGKLRVGIKVRSDVSLSGADYSVSDNSGIMDALD